MKHTTQIFSHLFSSLFSHTLADFSTHSTPLYPFWVNFSGLRLRIVPILLCLFLAITTRADNQVPEQKESPEQIDILDNYAADQTATKAITRVVNKPINDKLVLQKNEPKPIITNHVPDHVADRVADRVTEMVNSVINIARDPRNPHNLAFNITNALANIVHIVLLAKENKSLRSKLDNGLDIIGQDSSRDSSVDTEKIDFEKIDLEIEQAIRAYLENLDPQMQSRIASLIIKRLAID